MKKKKKSREPSNCIQQGVGAGTDQVFIIFHPNVDLRKHQDFTYKPSCPQGNLA